MVDDEDDANKENVQEVRKPIKDVLHLYIGVVSGLSLFLRIPIMNV
jgi:hypothetical protein